MQLILTTIVTALTVLFVFNKTFDFGGDSHLKKTREQSLDLFLIQLSSSECFYSRGSHIQDGAEGRALLQGAFQGLDHWGREGSSLTVIEKCYWVGVGGGPAFGVLEVRDLYSVGSFFFFFNF